MAGSLLNIGRPVAHVEGQAKVTGRTRYVGDVILPGMVWGKCLRSPYPHARIVSIDPSQAKAMPGVRAVLTAADLPDVLIGRWFMDCPILARSRVRFVGDKVAAVAADTPEIAEEALKLIEVEYEEMPAVFDPAAAMRPDAPRIHDDPAAYAHMPMPPMHGETHIAPPLPNVMAQAFYRHGDAAGAIAKAARVFEHSFYVPAMHQAYLEPHACAAAIDPDGKINIWLTNKMPFMARNQIANVLDLPPELIRVNGISLGGDFGGKGSLMDGLLCYFMAKAAGRPVKMVMTYAEDLMAANPRHSAVVTQRSGVDAEGRILARQIKIVYDCGAYGAFTPAPMLHGAAHGAGAYRVPNMEIEALRVYTNTVPRGYMRAPGTPQMLFGIESHMDIIAHELGLSPLEFRLRNVLTQGDEGALGEHWQPILGRQTLEAAAKAAGWDKPKPANVGRGIAMYEREPGAFGPSGVTLTIDAHGGITLITGVPDAGAGSLTMLQQVVAEELGMPCSAVTIRQEDTGGAPFETGLGGSRFTNVGGQAASIAAREVKQALIALAATNFKCEAGQVGMKRGRFTAPGGAAIDLPALMGWAEKQGQAPLTRSTSYIPKRNETTCFTAQIAEVEVDPATGHVRLRKLTTAHDPGTIINPLAFQGQVEGGVVQGIGQALTEQLVIEDGNVTNPHLGDYKLPTIRDIPELTTVIVESHAGPGPFASKAIGEHCSAAIPPAVANAVFDAVGVRLMDLPVTAEKVFAALRNKRRLIRPA